MVSASAICEDQEQINRAIEALSRVATGLAMEGQSIQISAVSYDPEEGE